MNEQQNTSEAAFFTSVRSWGITRGSNRVVGGVLSGVGRRINLATTPARILFVIAAIFMFPLAMGAYAFFWAVLPDAQGRIIVQDFGRGTINTAAVIGIVVLGIIAMSSFGVTPLFEPFGNDSPGFILSIVTSGLGFLALVAFLVWFFTSGPGHRSRQREQGAETPQQKHAAAMTLEHKLDDFVENLDAQVTSAANSFESHLSAAVDGSSFGTTTTGPAPHQAPRPEQTPPHIDHAAIEEERRVSNSPIVLLMWSAIFLTGAGLWWADRAGNLDVPPTRVWLAVVPGIIGLAIVAAALLSKRVAGLVTLGIISLAGPFLAYSVENANEVNLQVWNKKEQKWDTYGDEDGSIIITIKKEDSE